MNHLIALGNEGVTKGDDSMCKTCLNGRDCGTCALRVQSMTSVKTVASVEIVVSVKSVLSYGLSVESAYKERGVDNERSISSTFVQAVS